jgi:hypothetical protein
LACGSNWQSKFNIHSVKNQFQIRSCPCSAVITAGERVRLTFSQGVLYSFNREAEFSIFSVFCVFTLKFQYFMLNEPHHYKRDETCQKMSVDMLGNANENGSSRQVDWK